MAGPKKQNPAGGPGPFAQAAHLNEHREVCLNPGQLASAPVGIDRKRMPTLTSRDIAELTGKRHDHVLRDIEKMLADLGETSPQIWGDLNDAYGRPQRVAFLPKRETLILVSGYSVTLRARVIDRWQALEAAQAPALPTTFAAALRLAAEQAEQIEAQHQALTLAAPKVAFVDRYVAADTGCKGLREVCKILGANERHFVAYLIEAKVMYRLGGVLAPHAAHIDAGRLVVRTGEHHGHAFTVARFTPKGVLWISGEWGRRKAAAVLADVEAGQ